jgi:hypothetical protein
MVLYVIAMNEAGVYCIDIPVQVACNIIHTIQPISVFISEPYVLFVLNSQY